MIDTLLLLTIFFILEISFIHFTYNINNRYSLFAAMKMNMAMIPIFGAKIITLFGYITSVATLCYSFVVMPQLLIIEQYGPKIANQTMIALIRFMIFVTASMIIIDLFPTILINTKISEAVHLIVESYEQIAMATIIGYSLTQTTLIWTYTYLKTRMSGFMSYTTALFLAYIVSGVVFFPIAFHYLSFNLIINAIITSILFKMILAMLYYPFFAFYKAKIVEKERRKLK